jgi:hypothetical protein
VFEGNSAPMMTVPEATLADHAAGNDRVLMNRSREILFQLSPSNPKPQAKAMSLHHRRELCVA